MIRAKDTPVSHNLNQDTAIRVDDFRAINADNFADCGEDESASFLQSAFWSVFKSKTGWRAYYCRFSHTDAHESIPLYILCRSLPLGFSLAYIPHGPSSGLESLEPGQLLSSLAKALADQLPEKPLFFRFDLAWDMQTPQAELLSSAEYLKQYRLYRGTAVQVPDTVLLDLRQSEEEILAAMKPKWRYNIKLAAKKGILVSWSGKENLPVFMQLYRQTAQRDGIAIHTAEYYEKIFDIAARINEALHGNLIDVRLWIAEHEGDILAGIITLFYRGHAIYLYGASGNVKRNLMPAHALQWAAICAAKASGCQDYDFFGIPPNEDPNHPMAGLYKFKTGFGGRIVHRAGCYDAPVALFAYRVFKFMETARLYWHKNVKKRFVRKARQGSQSE